MDAELQITKQEYDYLVYISLVKIIAFLSIRYKYLDKSDINRLIMNLNMLFDKENLFDESNIITLGQKIIDDNFDDILRQMKEHIVDPEIVLSKSKFDQIQSNLRNDQLNSNFKNCGDMLTDYANGMYYRYFRGIREFVDEHNISVTDIGAGETLYHSFARFYAVGIDEYFNYFKKMCDNDLINFQNQSQERGFCNCIPCYYWFLNSKKDLKYFNELIQTKGIKLNHIGGNEHGPSALSIILDMLKNNNYWDRRKNKEIELDDEFKNILFETLFNIITSNYSVSYDSKRLLEAFTIFNKEDYIKKSMTYLLSDAGIQKQRLNNEYPIIRGGEIDRVYTESQLNKELDSMINSIKKLTII